MAFKNVTPMSLFKKKKCRSDGQTASEILPPKHLTPAIKQAQPRQAVFCQLYGGEGRRIALKLSFSIHHKTTSVTVCGYN